MRFVFFIFCFFALYASKAQQALDTSFVENNPDNLKVSILTCGTGDELYSSFGHIGVRVTDQVNRTDEVYNYGTFDYSDPNFYTKFTFGKLLYYISKSSYSDFIYGYEQEKRFVKEQVLSLPEEKKMAILHYLENNLKPENRAYHYDFLFDNCATRIRDIFPEVLGYHFFWGDILEGKKVPYRKVLNQYLANKHWERFGINLLLGSPVDSLMTDEGSMFLPDFLYQGLKGAVYEDQNMVMEESLILQAGPPAPRTLNGPLWMMIGILIITILAYLVPAFHYLKPIVRFILLFATGLLGSFMLFMWLFTDHQSCDGNYNILWALPTNIVIAFLAHRKMAILKVYGLAAISFLMVALIVHIIGIQQLSLIELSPLLLCLMYIYIDLYKNNIGVSEKNNAKRR